MITEVIMPKLGQTMEEGKIERWLKKKGDRVKKGEALLEVTTDKATLEVEAYGSGILRKVIVPDGETVPVTTVIGYIAEEDDKLPDKAEKADSPARPAGGSEPESEISVPLPGKKSELNFSRKERIKASPLAKRIAAEKGIDLGKVEGTGPGGRITKEDVLSAVSPAKTLTGLTPMRKAIAEQMAKSKKEIPHYYLTAEVDMSEVSKKRKNLKGISVTHFIIKAVATALSEFRQVNAIWEENGPRSFSEANIGIAVGLEDGIIVPVLRNAGKKTLREISSETGSLVSRAKERKLSAEEYSGATFTISNLGMFGIESFLPIINPPQAAILGIGAIKEKCIPVEGKIEIKPMMKLTLSVDHRAVDGACAAQFMRKLCSILETAGTGDHRMGDHRGAPLPGI